MSIGHAPRLPTWLADETQLLRSDVSHIPPPSYPSERSRSAGGNLSPGPPGRGGAQTHRTTPIPIFVLVCSSIVAADFSADVAGGDITHADTTNSVKPRPAVLAYCRNHVVRLKRRERHGLGRRCKGQGKGNSDQPDHSPPIMNLQESDFLEEGVIMRSSAQ